MPKCSRGEDSGVGQAKNNKMSTTPATGKEIQKGKRSEKISRRTMDDGRWMLPRTRTTAMVDAGARCCWEPLQTWDVQVLAKK